MKFLYLLLVMLTALILSNCGDEVVSSAVEIPIIVDYMKYNNGAHGNLLIKCDNKILYSFEEGDYDTIYVPVEWLEFTWEQAGAYREEVFPKEWRQYNIYNSMFKVED